LPSRPPQAGEIPLSDDDANLRRIRAANADKAEHDAEAARRKNALDEGRWVEAAAVQQSFGRQLSKMIAEFETFLGNTLPKAIGEKHGIDWKTLSAEIRSEFRKHRQTAAEAAKADREEREQALDVAAE
jgi:hypothetical protein